MTTVRVVSCPLYPAEDDDTEKAAVSDALVEGSDVHVVFLTHETVKSDEMLAMVSNLGSNLLGLVYDEDDKNVDWCEPCPPFCVLILYDL
jgi:hypothetical protein